MRRAPVASIKSRTLALVAGEIVHNHDVAAPEVGHEHLVDIGLEPVAVAQNRGKGLSASGDRLADCSCTITLLS